MIALIVINLGSSVIGSMVALVLWFHFDLEGHWQHRKYARAMRIGRKREPIDWMCHERQGPFEGRP